MKETRVAIYTRVSIDDQTTAAQEHELRQYAKHRGWTVQHVYTDQGYSGASRNDLPSMNCCAMRESESSTLSWSGSLTASPVRCGNSCRR